MAKFTFGVKDVVNAIPLSELIATQVSRLDRVCQIKVLSGFDFSIQNKVYHFSYKLTDQANFSSMTNYANTSLQLGNMTAQARESTYGTTLPAPLPSAWSCQWNGHTAEGESVVLTLSITEFLDLSAAAIVHNQTTLAKFREMKQALETCDNEKALILKREELKIDALELEASDLASKYDIVTSKAI